MQLEPADTKTLKHCLCPPVYRRAAGLTDDSNTQWLFSVKAPAGTTNTQLAQLRKAIVGGGDAAALFAGSPYARCARGEGEGGGHKQGGKSTRHCG